MQNRRRTMALLAGVSLAGGSVLAGCSAGGGSASSSAGSTTTLPAAAAPGAAQMTGGGQAAHSYSSAGSRSVVGVTVTPAAPLVIRNGSVTLGEPKRSILSVFNEVSSDAALLGGFVASSVSMSAADGNGAGLTLRVPSASFAALVAKVDGLGKVQAQQETGRDVTGESVDLSAELANLRSEEAALRTLLSRAGSIAAILQVQDQLFGVQGEIQQLSAQQGSLIDQATYATLTVSLMPLAAVAKPKPPKENAFVHAVRLALHNTWAALKAVLLALGWAFPILLLALLGLGGWRLWRRLGGADHRPAPTESAGV